MRSISVLSFVLPLALLGACDQGVAEAPMSGHEGHHAHGAHSAPAPAALVHAEGVVKAVDVSASVVTIDHQPIAALGWPHMVMPFETAPGLAGKVKVGDHVRFDLAPSGSGRRIVAFRMH